MGSKWPLVRLGDFCLKIGSGATPKGGSNVYDTTGSTYLIRSQNIYNDGFNTNGLVYISDEAATKLKNVIVQKNDVLLNITGDSVARVCLAQECFLPARVNQHVSIIRPNPRDFDPRFLRYYLASPYQQQTLLNLASAGATRNALTKGMIENLEVPKPPLNIQYVIANNLECFDSKISNNIQINQTLEQMAQALFKSWFVDFDPVIDNALDAGNPIPKALQERAELRQKVRKSSDFKPLPTEIRTLFPAEFEETELGWVPKGWEYEPVSKAIEINPSVKLSKGQNAKYIDMKALPISGYSISDVIMKPFSGGVKFQKNDILLARITPCLENGKTGFVDFLNDNEVGFGSTEFIVMKATYKVHFGYVACLSRNERFRSHAIQSMVGSSGRQRVQSSCFDNYYVTVPNATVMNNFAEKIENLFSKMSLNNAEISSLTQLRDTLLPKLISGELSLDDLPEAINEAKAA
ncbi:restriction endonuclease subunit S [Photorhabdus aegyptia]|uniref:Restriction endonuclease S subunit n=1 Tax=Photorhabdus aegyptia TaxID=2805098 RepID=A0A022PJ11_9GAMM|nr:restriction endonuclease subunit S [Photorhabdus aegyptia]EYU15499.1 restriction endonuclease S subunit [Photorhabdus aegyptia]